MGREYPKREKLDEQKENFYFFVFFLNNKIMDNFCFFCIFQYHPKVKSYWLFLCLDLGKKIYLNSRLSLFASTNLICGDPWVYLSSAPGCRTMWDERKTAERTWAWPRTTQTILQSLRGPWLSPGDQATGQGNNCMGAGKGCRWSRGAALKKMWAA